MKKGILVLLFLSLGSLVFAQKKPVKKTTKKATGKPAVKANTPSTTPATPVVTNYSQTPLAGKMDTSKNKNAAAAAALDLPMDGIYKNTNTQSAQPVVEATVREADAMFRKRVWREFDLREKMNQYMAAPQARLIDVLMEAIKAGELRAFDPSATKEYPNGDELKHPMTAEQTMRRLADSTMVTEVNNNGEKSGAHMAMTEFNPDSILKFRIKEDWIFDKQRGEFKPHIIAIAPLILIKTSTGTAIGDYQPAFWIAFAEARPILAAKEVFNKNNDASSLSYDQIFTKRIFASYIVKISNDKDERIKDYKNGIDRLYEAERIKKQLMDYELNLWQY